MELHADFSKRALVHGARVDWASSPMKGVERRMLDRIGDEVARATTIVRYAPHSTFSTHTHTGGEEFLVLEGVFQDEHGDFPAGSYVRNPPQSRHTPSSESGCTIFVKLWQFDPDDRTAVRIDTNKAATVPDPDRDGVQVTPLFRDAREDVRMERWPAGSTLSIGAEGGAEYFVLEGSFEVDEDTLEEHSWLRLPQGDRAKARVGAQGARVFVKTGHLPFARAPKL
ncbi:MAG: cupin domain-containing protein [Myxococcota bacterium]